jgi:hypothetical protein
MTRTALLGVIGRYFFAVVNLNSKNQLTTAVFEKRCAKGVPFWTTIGWDADHFDQLPRRLPFQHRQKPGGRVEPGHPLNPKLNVLTAFRRVTRSAETPSNVLPWRKVADTQR